MRAEDIADFCWRTLARQRTRSILMLLAMSIGVSAVLALTALGEGARRYVSDQFASLGTNLVIIFPGRSETSGTNPGLLISKAARDLTIDDAESLVHLPGVRRMAPINVGVGEIKVEQRVRETPIIGTTASWALVRRMTMQEGTFLPVMSSDQEEAVCVIGATIRREMFGSGAAVGQWLRIGDRKFRVVGVLTAKGQGLGFNNDEIVIVPVASAQALFNTNTLFRVLLETTGRSVIDDVRRNAEQIIAKRHQGELDVTVLSEDAVIATFDRILRTLTLAVTGIAAVSLAVAGLLIMNIMLIAVAQRRTEIGLLKAIGASPWQIRTLFLSEAGVLSSLGATLGLGLGVLAIATLRQLYPTFPAAAPGWAYAGAIGVALGTGLIFGWLPAKRAAAVDPVIALARR